MSEVPRSEIADRVFASFRRLESLGSGLLGEDFVACGLVASMVKGSVSVDVSVYGVPRNIAASPELKRAEWFQDAAQLYGMSVDEFEVAVGVRSIGSGAVFVHGSYVECDAGRPHTFEDFDLVMGLLSDTATTRWRARLDARDAAPWAWGEDVVVLPQGVGRDVIPLAQAAAAACLRGVDRRLGQVVIKVRWDITSKFSIRAYGSWRKDGASGTLGFISGHPDRDCRKRVGALVIQVASLLSCNHFYLLVDRASQSSLRTELTTNGHQALRFFQATEGSRMRALLRKA